MIGAQTIVAVTKALDILGLNRFGVRNFDNISKLRAQSGMYDGQQAMVTSYYSGWAAKAGGPSGGGSFVWDAASTATDDGGSVFQVTGVATGRWKRIFQGSWCYAEDFGAKAQGANAVDDTAYVQAAIDYWYNLYGANASTGTGDGQGGAVRFRDGKKYGLTHIYLKPGVSLKGESYKVTFSENKLYTNGPQLMQLAGQTGPMVQNDTTLGLVRATSEVDGRDQHYLNSTIAGLCFVGIISSASSTTDNDLLRLTRAWCATVEGNTFLNTRGFGLAILDCNEVQGRSNTAINAPVIVEDSADCTLLDMDLGGSNGMCQSVLWFTGPYCAKNQWSGWAYNNNLAGFRAAAVAVSSIDTATDTITFTAAHGFTTGYPIVMDEATGTPPNASVTGGALSRAVTYYAIVVNSTRIKLATNRYNADLGTAIDLTSAGVSVLFTCGFNGGTVLSNGANENNCVRLRGDLNYGDAIICNGAPGNTFDDYELIGNGYGSSTARTGIRLINGSINTAIGVGKINGVAVNYVGLNSNQGIGISVDSTSRKGLQISLACVVINHSTASFSPANINPNAIVITAQQMREIAGAATPTWSADSQGRHYGYSFSNSADGLVSFAFYRPAGWGSCNITFAWANDGGLTGTVQWHLDIGWVQAGESYASADAISLTTTAAAAGAQDIRVDTLFPFVDLSQAFGRDPLFGRAKRVVAGGTLANAAKLYSIIIEKVN